MEIIDISGVKGRWNNKQKYAELNLEDVARGLGFTEVKNETEYVRWRTVRSYLEEFGYSQQVAKDTFIPENIFYRLCFKASNEKAREFQDLVTDGILPSIRKHGAYMTPDTIEKALLEPDFLIQLATQLKDEQEQRKQLEETIEEQKPKVTYADSVSVAQNSMLVGELAKLIKQNGFEIGQNRLFEWMRDSEYLCKRKGNQYNTPTQRSMDMELFEVKTRTINNPDGSTRTVRTTMVTGKGQIYFVNKFNNLKQQSIVG